MATLAMATLLIALIHLAAPAGAMPHDVAPSEDGNFLCTRSYGPGAYPLPCKPARDHWQSAFRHTFAITAWYPPQLHCTNGTYDLSEIKPYAAAGFNMLFGGDGNIGCHGIVQPFPMDTPEQRFYCLVLALRELRKLGLKLAFHPTDASAVTSPGAAGRTVGAGAGMGGITDSGPGSWSITEPEVAWVVGQLKKHNVSDVVAQIFFHDDEIGDSGATAAAVRWMRENSPEITPQANTFGDSAPEALYSDGQFLFSAEQYAITGSDPSLTANATTKMINEELIMFANDQLLTERYRLDYWPLFALGDGGDVSDVTSDSLVRVQVYSAIAYGARGIYYYCWEHGVWNSTAFNTGHPELNYLPLANYMTVKKCNADAAKFGTMLLDSRHVGSVRRPSDPRNDHSIAPGSSSVVEAMDDQLLVGVFSDGRESETGYLMVVDLRGSTIPGAIAPRTVTLTIHPGCATAVVPGPAGGWFAESDTAPESAVSKGTQQVALTLQGGGGALLRITAGTGGCGQLLRSTRQWWYDPRTINLKHSYPETSLKSATYGGSTWMPQGFDSGEYTDGNVAGHDGNNEMTRDATGQGYGRGWCNERPCLPGRYRYFHKPGGLAGADSSFIIGGSQWESSSAAVWSSDAEAKAWADAAFLMVSFPAEASATALGNGIAWGTSHGIFTLLSTQLSGTVMDPDLLVQLATNYSCHTNFAGFVLGSNFSAAGTDVDAVVKAADTLRSEAYWQLPLVLGVDSVDTAAKLGDQGVPLPAVQLTFEHTGSALEWARRTVGMLAPLASPAGRNATMTPAVSIDPCGTDSDSMMRFAAYTSVLLGGQALWWEGMGRCAPVGSSTFETVSSINNRVAQWAEPLFMRKVDYVPKGSWLADDIDDDVDAGSKKNRGKVSNAKAGQSVPPFGNTSFFIDAVYSTSSIKLPPLPGANGSLVHAQPPGSTFAALIQAMDPELIVVNLRNATSFGKNHTSECKTAAGPQGQDCINYDSVLWIISTNLSTLRGGAPVQQLNISMHESVWTTHPIEPDKYQGFSTDCNLAWLGPNMPLRLPGGSVQVVSYSIGPLTSSAMTSRATRPKSQRVGRRAPSQWPGIKMDDTTSALAPSLTHPSDELRQPPASAALTWVQARRGQAADVYVDCDHGSDTHTGRSASSAVATLEKARSLVRKLRSTATFVATGATVVEVRGKCQLTKALQLTKNDSGTASSPIVWRGMDGAVIGAGRKLTNWTKVNWPGAPLGSVLRASVPKEDFPLIVTGTGPSASGWIKSLRVITPDASAALIEDQWVARARWPKPTPGNSQAAGFEGKNYSSGWLSSANWTKHESVGLDPAVVPPEIYADYWNLFVNNFGLDGERDVINDLSRVHAANLSALQPSLSVSLEEGTEKSQRFFLENVQSALAEGEFYVSFNESALYVWPKAAWKHPDGHVEMVAPLDVHVLNMSNADHVIISNLTFRDSGYEEAGCWCGPANEPSDSAISIWNSSFVTVEASTFLPGVSGWAVAATGGGQHLHIVGNRVHAVGQGGFLLYSGGLLGGASIKASKTLACNHSIVEWNVVERAGRILKHVAGVAFRAASWCTARHNRIVDMPRYAFDADTVWPELIGISNIFEYNIIDGASLETSDTGAMQFTGQGPMFDLPTPFDMNTTIQYNNISRVMGADAVDGRI